MGRISDSFSGAICAISASQPPTASNANTLITREATSSSTACTVSVTITARRPPTRV